MMNENDMIKDWQYLATALDTEIDYIRDHLRGFIEEGKASMKKLCDQQFEGKAPGDVEPWDCDENPGKPAEVIRTAKLVCDAFANIQLYTDDYDFLLRREAITRLQATWRGEIEENQTKKKGKTT